MLIRSYSIGVKSMSTVWVVPPVLKLILDILFSVLLLFDTNDGLDGLEPEDLVFPVKLEPSLGRCLAFYTSANGLFYSN